MKEIQVTTLDNGLRVASDLMPMMETATVGVWIDSGTRYERAEVNGVAHLLEHMVFKGTKKRDARRIAEDIEDVGGSMNAYTARENTAYFARVLKEDVSLGVDVIADILQYPLFDPEELARERSVVLQEIGQANDTPDDIIFDYFQEIAFPDQPLGYPVLGLPEIVSSLSRDALIDYRDGHYSPQNVVLVGSGNVDHDALVQLGKQHFNHLPGPQPRTEIAGSYKGGQRMFERDLEQFHVVLGFEGPSYRADDYYTASVLSTLLGGGMSSRLFQEIRENRGLVYSIYSFTASYNETGLFGIYAASGPESAKEIMPVIWDEIDKLANDPPPEEEVARSRSQLKASLLMSLESTMARCEQLGQHLLIFGRPLTTEEIVADIEAVTPEMLQHMAQKMFAQPPTLTALGPGKPLAALGDVNRRTR